MIESCIDNLSMAFAVVVKNFFQFTKWTMALQVWQILAGTQHGIDIHNRDVPRQQRSDPKMSSL